MIGLEELQNQTSRIQSSNHREQLVVAGQHIKPNWLKEVDQNNYQFLIKNAFFMLDSIEKREQARKLGMFLQAETFDIAVKNIQKNDLNTIRKRPIDVQPKKSSSNFNILFQSKNKLLLEKKQSDKSSSMMGRTVLLTKDGFKQDNGKLIVYPIDYKIETIDEYEIMTEELQIKCLWTQKIGQISRIIFCRDKSNQVPHVHCSNNLNFIKFTAVYFTDKQQGQLLKKYLQFGKFSIKISNVLPTMYMKKIKIRLASEFRKAIKRYFTHQSNTKLRSLEYLRNFNDLKLLDLTQFIKNKCYVNYRIHKDAQEQIERELMWQKKNHNHWIKQQEFVKSSNFLNVQVVELQKFSVGLMFQFWLDFSRDQATKFKAIGDQHREPQLNEERKQINLVITQISIPKQFNLILPKLRVTFLKNLNDPNFDLPKRLVQLSGQAIQNAMPIVNDSILCYHQFDIYLFKSESDIKSNQYQLYQKTQQLDHEMLCMELIRYSNIDRIVLEIIETNDLSDQDQKTILKNQFELTTILNQNGENQLLYLPLIYLNNDNDNDRDKQDPFIVIEGHILNGFLKCKNISQYSKYFSFRTFSIPLPLRLGMYIFPTNIRLLKKICIVLQENQIKQDYNQQLAYIYERALRNCCYNQSQIYRSFHLVCKLINTENNYLNELISDDDPPYKPLTLNLEEENNLKIFLFNIDIDEENQNNCQQQLQEILQYEKSNFRFIMWKVFISYQEVWVQLIHKNNKLNQYEPIAEQLFFIIQTQNMEIQQQIHLYLKTQLKSKHFSDQNYAQERLYWKKVKNAKEINIILQVAQKYQNINRITLDDLAIVDALISEIPIDESLIFYIAIKQNILSHLEQYHTDTNVVNTEPFQTIMLIVRQYLSDIPQSRFLLDCLFQRSISIENIFYQKISNLFCTYETINFVIWDFLFYQYYAYKNKIKVNIKYFNKKELSPFNSIIIIAIASVIIALLQESEQIISLAQSYQDFETLLNFYCVCICQINNFMKCVHSTFQTLINNKFQLDQWIQKQKIQLLQHKSNDVRFKQKIQFYKISACIQSLDELRKLCDFGKNIKSSLFIDPTIIFSQIHSSIDNSIVSPNLSPIKDDQKQIINSAIKTQQDKNIKIFLSISKMWLQSSILANMYFEVTYGSQRSYLVYIDGSQKKNINKTFLFKMMDDANYIKVNIYQQTLNSKNIMIESLSIIKQLKIKLEAHPLNQLINKIANFTDFQNINIRDHQVTRCEYNLILIDQEQSLHIQKNGDMIFISENQALKEIFHLDYDLITLCSGLQKYYIDLNQKYQGIQQDFQKVTFMEPLFDSSPFLETSNLQLYQLQNYLSNKYGIEANLCINTSETILNFIIYSKVSISMKISLIFDLLIKQNSRNLKSIYQKLYFQQEKYLRFETVRKFIKYLMKLNFNAVWAQFQEEQISSLLDPGQKKFRSAKLYSGEMKFLLDFTRDIQILANSQQMLFSEAKEICLPIQLIQSRVAQIYPQIDISQCFLKVKSFDTWLYDFNQVGFPQLIRFYRKDTKVSKSMFKQCLVEIPQILKILENKIQINQQCSNFVVNLLDSEIKIKVMGSKDEFLSESQIVIYSINISIQQNENRKIIQMFKNFKYQPQYIINYQKKIKDENQKKFQFSTIEITNQQLQMNIFYQLLKMETCIIQYLYDLALNGINLIQYNILGQLPLKFLEFEFQNMRLQLQDHDQDIDSQSYEILNFTDLEIKNDLINQRLKYVPQIVKDVSEYKPIALTQIQYANQHKSWAQCGIENVVVSKSGEISRVGIQYNKKEKIRFTTYVPLSDLVFVDEFDLDETTKIKKAWKI